LLENPPAAGFWPLRPEDRFPLCRKPASGPLPTFASLFSRRLLRMLEPNGYRQRQLLVGSWI